MENTQEKKTLKLYGTPWPIYLAFFVVLLIAIALDVVPGGLIGAFIVSILLGELLHYFGEITPIVNKYLGGGAIVCIFGGSFLTYTGVINETLATSISSFVSSWGFIDFTIIGLITGSILGMNSRTIVSVGWRYFVSILGCIVVSFLGTGLMGALLGYGFNEAILYVAAPVIGGGGGAGAVPMSSIYASALGESADYYLSIMFPAVSVGNAIAIICAGLLPAIAKKFPKLSGNGQLMEGVDETKDEAELNFKPTLVDLGAGLLVALAMYTVGCICAYFIPDIHAYAFMIIATIILKLTHALPRELELAASYWYQFVSANLIKILVFGVGVALIDFGQVLDLFSDPVYFILVVCAVVFAAIGGGLFGMLVKLKFIEASVTGGLCMANAGGTGDVATLGAAKCLNLMPFAAVSSRLGGAFILILMSFLTRIL